MAWPRDAFVGQKVVHHMEPPHRPTPDEGYSPKIGEVFTIRKIVIESATGEVGFLFEEIINPIPWPSRNEPSYTWKYFRPVDPASKKADRGLAALRDGIKTVREREEA